MTLGSDRFAGRPLGSDRFSDEFDENLREPSGVTLNELTRRRRERLMESPRLAGEKQRHVTRENGAVVVVFDGREQDLDEECGRWYTGCLLHEEYVAHYTLKLARWHAPNPTGWCQACADRQAGSGRTFNDPLA